MSALKVVGLAIGAAIVLGGGLLLRRLSLDLAEARRRGLNSGVFDKWHEQAEARRKLLISIIASIGPSLSFLTAYLIAAPNGDQRFFFATAVFMAVAVVSMVTLRSVQRKIWPPPWTTLLIVVMGGLTLWLRDERFIKMRPTFQYGLGGFSAIYAMTTAHPKLAKLRQSFDEYGQRAVKVFAVGWGMTVAAANEFVWRNSSTLFWLGFQMWGPILIFGLALALVWPTLRLHFVGNCRVRTSA